MYIYIHVFIPIEAHNFYCSNHNFDGETIFVIIPGHIYIHKYIYIYPLYPIVSWFQIITILNTIVDEVLSHVVSRLNLVPTISDNY
jgi:hypothetical protein